MAQVSLPAKARSEIRTASSAPMAMASRRADSACRGPIEITVTRPVPRRAFSRSPSSMAYMSKGLTIAATPSRTRVWVTGSILQFPVSGTCLTQTTICMSSSPEANGS